MTTRTLARVSALLLGASSVHAATVYDLSTGAGTDFYHGISEVGDELRLSGTDRIIESFSFDYFSNYSEISGLTFRIYANNGPLLDGSKVPGDLLDTRTLDLAAGGGHVLINFPFDGSNVLPDVITYTATFNGIASNPLNQAGLVLANSNPTIGSSFDDIWQRTGSGTSDWTLIHVTDLKGAPIIGNFKATVTATPEPGTIALLALGGLGLLVLVRRHT